MKNLTLEYIDNGVCQPKSHFPLQKRYDKDYPKQYDKQRDRDYNNGKKEREHNYSIHNYDQPNQKGNAEGYNPNGYNNAPNASNNLGKRPNTS